MDQRERDAQDLGRFGYAQQLLRDMGGFSNFALSFTLISVLTGAVTLFGQGLAYGGPAANGLGWPLVTIFTLTVAASMAEIASAIPTAGAMYHWSLLLGGPAWGWTTAWLNLVGQVATTAGIDYGIAAFLCDLLGLSTHAWLLPFYVLLLLGHALLNHYGIRLVARLNDVSAWYHLVVTLALTAAFAIWGRRQPVPFAFRLGFTTVKTPYAWAFLLSLLQAQWTLTGYDASAHVTEETVDPRRNAPWGMVNAVWLSGVVGYALVVAVTLAISDLPSAAAADNPFLFICQGAFGPAFGKAVVWAALPAMWFCGLSSVTTNARMIFAFARDGGLPASPLWASVSQAHRTPAAAVWLSATLAMAVALYGRAYGVIVTLSTIGLYLSYALPIALVLRARARGRWTELGPWTLGRFGAVVNWAAVLWTALITVLFVAPPNQRTGYALAGLLAAVAAGYPAWRRARAARMGPALPGVFLLALAAARPASAAGADLILRGGRVFLGPGQYAQGVAVAGNRIVEAGDDAVVLALRGPKTRVIDLAGRAVTPGFHDAHTRFFNGALFLTQVDLNGAGSIAEVQRRIARYAEANPQVDWILGRGWDTSTMSDARPLNRHDLDAAVPTRPVALIDADGHSLCLNSEGLHRIGLGKLAPELRRQPLAREPDGQPSGLLIEGQMSMATRVIPQTTRRLVLEALRGALAAARENGVTAAESLQDSTELPLDRQIGLWRELMNRREVTLRLFLYGRLEDPEQAVRLRRQTSDIAPTRFGVVGVTGSVDGAIGARTAALLKPYTDDPKTAGEPTLPQRRLAELVWGTHKRGLQVALRAVGDRAVRMALDACAASQRMAQDEEVVLPSYPCRIEHADVVAPADFPRFAALRAAVSMQPARMTYPLASQNDYPERLGDRVKQAFALKSLEDAGALLAFGTGWPVTPLAPRLALFAATTRQHYDGLPPGGWVPEQRIGLESAIEHATIDSARAIGHGDEMGAIRPGKLADLVVFDRDIFAIPGPELLKAQVDVTVYDGRVVFERKK